MNAPEAKALWLVAAEIWPAYAVPAAPELISARLDVWLGILGDLDARVVKAALLSLATRDFAPPPGTLRERAVELMMQASGEARIPDADEALEEFRRQLSTVGHVGQPSWSHRAIGDAVRALGGWTVCCEARWDATLRAQFRDCYRSAAARAERDAKSAPPAVAAITGTAVPELDRG